MTEKRQISQGYIIHILHHFATKLWNITNFVMLFQAVMLLMKFCLESCLDQKLVYNASGPFQPAKIWGTKEYYTAIRSVHKTKFFAQ
jgi:hypothetical protein